MLFQFNFYSSILLIFFVHFMVYAFLNIKKYVQEKTEANKWLGIFLLLFALYITPWMIGFAGWYDNQPYRDILFYTPFHHLYLMGVCMFFYVQSLVNPSFVVTKKMRLHFVPAALYLVYSAIVVITDKLVLKQYYFLANQNDLDFEVWYQITGFFSLFVYFILSIRYFRMYQKVIVQIVSYADAVLFQWIKNFLWAFSVLLLERLIFFAAGIFFNITYSIDWWQYFIGSTLVYYIAINGYANATQSKLGFKQLLVATNKPLLLLNNTKEVIEEIEYEEVTFDKTITKEENDQLQLLQQQLDALMKKGQFFLDADLSLPQVAKALQTNVNTVSKTINQCFGKNFNDYVNEFRVHEMINRLQNGEAKNQTLVSIAYDCGFNSKATFNRAFKKHTGKKPTDYL